jgi:hypothetical protein
LFSGQEIKTKEHAYTYENTILNGAEFGDDDIPTCPVENVTQRADTIA